MSKRMARPTVGIRPTIALQNAMLIPFPYRARMKLIRNVARQLEPLGADEARKLMTKHEAQQRFGLTRLGHSEADADAMMEQFRGAVEGEVRRLRSPLWSDGAA